MALNASGEALRFYIVWCEAKHLGVETGTLASREAIWLWAEHFGVEGSSLALGGAVWR